MAQKYKKEHLAWGIILILIGLIFLLDNIHVNVWNAFARLWPLVIIAWGAWKLYFGIKERGKEK
ncbi:MAG: LiaF transmembrane domain-containing protein [Acidobacteriota bacterium]